MMTAVNERANLRQLADMQVEAVVEVGRKRMKLRQARQLHRGDVITLDKLAGEAFSVTINGTPFADGEIVVVGDLVACRLTHMAPVPGVNEAEVAEDVNAAGPPTHQAPTPGSAQTGVESVT
jgi:flagellar motor switch protein FliN